MRVCNLAIAILLPMLAGACGRDNGPWHPPHEVGPLGVIEDQSSGLIGIDANKNGIRDDIDALIAKKYSSADATRKAAEQRARAVQALMVSTTPDQSVAAANAILRASGCQFQVIADEKLISRMSAEIRALTANTKERLTAYLQANMAIGSQVFHVSNANQCD